MSKDKKINLNALGQAIDNSWGRSSTPQTASYSVKTTLLPDDRLLLTYQAIVNFGTERQLIEMKRRYADEAKAITDGVLKRIKEIYKDLSGSSLATKEAGVDDSIEIISVTFHNPKRTAYFRRKTIVEIG
jgi:hypothetical protein